MGTISAPHHFACPPKLPHKPNNRHLLRLAQQLMDARMELPEASVGNVSIKHKNYEAGQKLTVVGIREAMFTGLPPTDLLLDQPTTIHQLVSEEDGVWMTDQPCELVQMWRELGSKVRGGNVLIGGLGLGIVANMVHQAYRSVHRIVVIEKDPDVIKLISPYLNHSIEVMEGDLHEYIRSRTHVGAYHCALLDIWQGTGEWIWQEQVVPLRRAIGRSIRRVFCWQEQVMQNQVAGALFRMADTDQNILRRYYSNHYYAFRKGIIDMGIRTDTPKITGSTDFPTTFEVEQDNRNDAKLWGAMRLFLGGVGTSLWEQWFGKYWDEAWALKERRNDQETNTPPAR